MCSQILTRDISIWNPIFFLLKVIVSISRYFGADKLKIADKDKLFVYIFKFKVYQKIGYITKINLRISNVKQL